MLDKAVADFRALSDELIAVDEGTVVYERAFEPYAPATPVEQWTNAVGWVSTINRDESTGIHVYHPPVAALFTAAKRLMRDIAVSHGFEEHIFPRHYTPENLRAFGWLDDRDRARELVAIRPMEPDEARGNALSLGDPVQCLGFYAMLAELQQRCGGFLPRELFEDGPLCVYEDQGGWTLRNETRQRLESGWSTSFEFAGAEFVFAGYAEQVYRTRWDVLCSIVDLLTELRITHRVVTARPCFHTDADGTEAASKARVYNVPTLDVQAYIPQYAGSRDPWVEIGGGDVAGETLISAFGLRVPSGEPLLSGCQGLGWQRFALAVLSQLGPEPANWPDRLQRVYGSSVPRSKIGSVVDALRGPSSAPC